MTTSAFAPTSFSESHTTTVPSVPTAFATAAPRSCERAMHHLCIKQNQATRFLARRRPTLSVSNTKSSELTPALARLMAIGPPIAPSPTKPILPMAAGAKLNIRLRCTRVRTAVVRDSALCACCSCCVRWIRMHKECRLPRCLQLADQLWPVLQLGLHSSECSEWI